MNIITNPDKDFVIDIKRRIKENNGYCPCKLVKNKDTKCMCKEFKEKIEKKEYGECRCGLYILTDEG